MALGNDGIRAPQPSARVSRGERAPPRSRVDQAPRDALLGQGIARDDSSDATG
jgi:hypothetical protein